MAACGAPPPTLPPLERDASKPDSGHLIAPSRRAAVEPHPACTRAVTKHAAATAGTTSDTTSPRIAAVHGTDTADWFGGFGSSWFGNSLLGLFGGTEVGDSTPELAATGTSDADDSATPTRLHLRSASSSDEGREVLTLAPSADSPGAPRVGHSPAHLLAAACHWQPSPLAASTGAEAGVATEAAPEPAADTHAPEPPHPAFGLHGDGQAAARSLQQAEQQQCAEQGQQPDRQAPSQQQQQNDSTAQHSPAPCGSVSDGLASAAASLQHAAKAWSTESCHIELSFEPDTGEERHGSCEPAVPFAGTAVLLARPSAARAPRAVPVPPVRDLSAAWPADLQPPAAAAPAHEPSAAAAPGHGHVVGAVAAGQYDALLQRLCQLDMPKIK